MVARGKWESPVGGLELIERDGVVVRLDFLNKDKKDKSNDGVVMKQLREYFQGKRTKFDFKTSVDGTVFQKKVWEEMSKIPYGKTISYTELAKRVGNPKAIRAVANACGKNPLPIIIPCHRIVASNGKMGGYSGGLWRKEWLLKLEGVL
jgi:methylated-DNA-[protein]-cysteine S-methyltransferase